MSKVSKHALFHYYYYYYYYYYYKSVDLELMRLLSHELNETQITHMLGLFHKTHNWTPTCIVSKQVFDHVVILLSIFHGCSVYGYVKYYMAPLFLNNFPWADLVRYLGVYFVNNRRKLSFNFVQCKRDF